MNKVFLCALAVSLITVSAVAGSVPPPFPTASNVSSATVSHDLTTSDSVLPGDGAPMPSCFPGKNCGDSSQQQTIAGDGAPMPSCFPGKNCGDSSQQQTIAGDGAPMPSCFPGKNCGDSSQQQTIARADTATGRRS